MPDEVINFQDGVFGRQECNLADHCGDFVLRRADGAWAYQLAVVVDDAAMGVTEVCGHDSAPTSNGGEADGRHVPAYIMRPSLWCGA